MEIWRLSKDDIEKRTRDALAGDDDDATLRTLEWLARSWHFGQLVDIWGPALYRRNRAAFLGAFHRRVQPHPVHVTRAREGWIDEVEAAGDERLYRTLYQARILSLGPEAWHADLARVWDQGAANQRAAGLAKLVLPRMAPPDALALRFYREDPDAARDWLLRAAGGCEEPGRQDALIEAAQSAGDLDFADALFALNLDFEAWEERTRKLARTVSNPDELGRALERILPVRARRSVWVLEDHFGGLPKVITEIAEQRADLAPWLRRRHGRLKFAGAWADLAELAWSRRDQPDWFALWTALSRSSTGHAGFHRAVTAAVKELDRPRARSALFALGGATEVWDEQEYIWQSEERFWQLDADAFDAVLTFSPQALLGPMRPHVRFNVIDTKRFQRVVDVGNEELIDLVTARLLTAHPGWGPSRVNPKKVLGYWRVLQGDGPRFIPRVLRVLGFLEPRNPFWHRWAGKEHPLRGFFLDPELPWLDAPGALRDLLECAAPSVRTLALRIMRAARPDDDRLKTEVAACHDILAGYLFLEQPSRQLKDVLFALRLTTSELSSATALVASLRDALVLHHPGEGSLRCRDLLAAELAHLLTAWPGLRRPTERPVVHRRQA